MMRQSKPISEVNQVVTIVEEDLDTALDGYSVRKAGSASMAMINPGDFNTIVEMGQFQQLTTSEAPSKHNVNTDALAAPPSSPRWPPRNYLRNHSNFLHSSFSSNKSSSSSSDKSDSSCYARQTSIEIHEDDCQDDAALDLTLSKFSLSNSERTLTTSGGF